jgi:hypothetical protein
VEREDGTLSMACDDVFESLEQWIEWMKADHADYTCGDE